jgi:diketogulonate reductase-like aldo/keto reductase
MRRTHTHAQARQMSLLVYLICVPIGLVLVSPGCGVTDGDRVNFIMLRFQAITVFLYGWLTNCIYICDSAPAQYYHLPKLGLGTAGLGSATESVVANALNIGIRLIDTAQAQEWYDEKAVAKALQAYPAVIRPIVVTKIHPRSYELSAMRSALQTSSHNFGAFGLHTVLLHAPFCWRDHCTREQEAVHWSTAWRNLELLQDEFDIALIGVSNFEYHQLEDLLSNVATRNVSVLQNWMDPFHQDQQVRAFAKQHNIQYMAYSSFGTQWYNKRNNPVLNSSVLNSLSKKYQCNVARVVLAWLLAEGVTAIPRTSKIEHMEENFGVCKGGDNVLCNDGELDVVETFLTAEDLHIVRMLDGTIGVPWEQ